MKLSKFTKGCDDSTLPPGTKAKIYLACTCEVTNEVLRTYAVLRGLTTLPSGVTLPTVENKLAELATIGEPIAFSGTGNGFTAYDIVIHSGSYTSKTQGEIQFLAFDSELTFSFAGTDAEVLGFSQMVLNRGLVGLVGDVGGENDYTLFGQKDIPAYIMSADIQSGSKPGDKRMASFKLQDVSGRSLKKYPLATLHPSGLPIAS